jgi:hypothetical protein
MNLNYSYPSSRKILKSLLRLFLRPPRLAAIRTTNPTPSLTPHPNSIVEGIQLS